MFGDALRRLAAAATYLYQDGPRYWYATQPTVTKLAEDRAEQLKRDPDKVAQELEQRLRLDLRKMGDFSRVHPLPGASTDVSDDLDARLVVLGIGQAYSKESGNAAEVAAKTILEQRGTTPRLYRNSLTFLVADKTRIQDLDEAVRKYLAWESILREQETLDLSPHQVKQAETQRASADSVVTARIPETYQWLLVPKQLKPQVPVEWLALKLAGQEALAVRASKKLRSDEQLVLNLAPTSLKLELDKTPLWRGDHVAVRQLVEDFGRYHYLPRLRNPSVLLDAIQAGVNTLTWELDTFAYADSYAAAAGRYRGLRTATLVTVSEHDGALLVKAAVARRQLDAEATPPPPDPVPPVPLPPGGDNGPTVTPGPGPSIVPPPPGPPPAPKPRRFHGTVTLDSARVGRDASKIADELITHLVGLLGASVRVTLEIEADIPNGTPDNVVRTVTENSRVLKFTQAGFEDE